MKKSFLLLAIISVALASCGDNNTDNQATEREDTVTNAVKNAEGAENNPYNLPGSDTGAIHENTDQPGVLDKDARDSTAGQGPQ